MLFPSGTEPSDLSANHVSATALADITRARCLVAVADALQDIPALLALIYKEDLRNAAASCQALCFSPVWRRPVHRPNLLLLTIPPAVKEPCNHQKTLKFAWLGLSC